MANRQEYNGPDLYHYTSKQGAAGIAKSGVIHSSKATMKNLKTDLLLGPGVYASSLDPSHSKEEILLNNYGSGLLAQVEKQGKADYFVKIPKEVIQRQIDKGAKIHQANKPGRENVFVIQDEKDQEQEKYLNKMGFTFD